VLELASGVVLVADGKVRASGAIGEVTSRLDLPPEAEALGLGAILEGRIDAHDEARGLTAVATPAGLFQLPVLASQPGARLVLRVAAKDVAIALQAPDAISVQNMLPATVEDIRHHAPHAVRLALRAGEARLLAEITDDARRRLSLEPGTKVVALVKSVALVRAP
jgi:molybdate transport system ATP-binding protein